nr:DUF1989 domain-containing protein [Amycolatopsis pithecellobii]
MFRSPTCVAVVDGDGDRVHDLLGSRCDPCTNRLRSGEDFDVHCRSNLTRAVPAPWADRVRRARVVTSRSGSGGRKHAIRSRRTGRSPSKSGAPQRKTSPAGPSPSRRRMPEAAGWHAALADGPR